MKNTNPFLDRIICRRRAARGVAASSTAADAVAPPPFPWHRGQRGRPPERPDSLTPWSIRADPNGDGAWQTTSARRSPPAQTRARLQPGPTPRTHELAGLRRPAHARGRGPRTQAHPDELDALVAKTEFPFNSRRFPPSTAPSKPRPRPNPRPMHPDPLAPAEPSSGSRPCSRPGNPPSSSFVTDRARSICGTRLPTGASCARARMPRRSRTWIFDDVSSTTMTRSCGGCAPSTACATPAGPPCWPLAD